MTWPTYVEVELDRARKMTAKDHKQRWVLMNGTISETPVPFKDAISVYWIPIVDCVTYTYRPAKLAHNAIGSI